MCARSAISGHRAGPQAYGRGGGTRIPPGYLTSCSGYRGPALLAVLFSTGLEEGKERARARNNSSWKEKEKSEGLNKWGHDSARQPAARALRATAEKQRWTGR